jgi:hypothetical protein
MYLYLSQAMVCGIKKREGEFVPTRQKGSNFQEVNGSSPIGSGMTWMITADSQHSRQFPTFSSKSDHP